MKNNSCIVKKFKISTVFFLVITALVANTFLSIGSTIHPLNDTYEITATTDQDQYYRNETVFISGRLMLNDDGAANMGVCIDIVDSLDNLILGICTGTNDTGYFTFQFSGLDEQSPLGEYLVKVGMVEDETVFVDFSFFVVSSELDIQSYGPYTGKPLEDIQFTSNISGGKEPYSLLWEFGDEGTSTEQNPVYNYSTPGVFQVNLTVWDAGWLVSTVSTLAIISNISLTVSTDQLYYYGNETVIISGQLSEEDQGIPGDMIIITITEPDDNASTIVTSPTDMVGNYSVQLYLPYGSLLGEYSVQSYHQSSDTPAYTSFFVVDSTVTVETTGPYQGVADELITMNALVTGGKPPYSFFWEFGDDTNSTGQQVTHAYSTPGVYTIRLTVTDNDILQANTTTQATISEQTGFTHTVLVEYATGTFCGPCVPASEQLYDIFKKGEQDFYYVSMVIDKSNIAKSRHEELTTNPGVPNVFFDGNFSHLLGAQSSSQPYKNKIDECGHRTTWNIDLDLQVNYTDNDTLQYTVTAVNHEPETYKGTVRLYIVEPLSRWRNNKGDPYHYGVLDIVTRSVTVNSDWSYSAEWDAFDDISEHNIMIIASVFREETGFVDETTSATPAPVLAVSITQPVPGLYIRNTLRRSFFIRQKPLIIGKIDIQAEVLAVGTNVETLRFVINGETMHTKTSPPFSYTWNKRYLFSFSHTIEVIVEDTQGVTASDKIQVIKIL